MTETYEALGLMSGTSLDGIDVAYITTDGKSLVEHHSSASFPYEPDFQEKLKACFHKPEGPHNPEIKKVERALTMLHASAVNRFLEEKNLVREKIDIIGFHGQTTHHNPSAKETIQLGDGQLLSEETGIDVVNDFRTADVKAGGQGAPLIPLYHRALAGALSKPVAFINIGGVSNLTWIGGESDEDLIAFDTGPGNALLNDWMLRYAKLPYDKDGALAAKGHVDENHVGTFLDQPYFHRKGPKSLDRDDFERFVPHHLSPEDGAATLTMMTVQTIATGLRQAGDMPTVIYLMGGGAHNKTMCDWLAHATGAQIKTAEDLGLRIDAIEAEGFAYLAVRHLLNLPLSVPNTTGVEFPMLGGRLHKVRRSSNA